MRAQRWLANFHKNQEKKTPVPQRDRDPDKNPPRKTLGVKESQP